MIILDKYFNQYMKKIADNFLIKLKKGKLNVTYPNGDLRMFVGEKSGYDADINLNNYRLFSKLLRKGSTGFAESYMDGDFNTSNLSNLLLFGLDNESDFLESRHNYSFIEYYIKFRHDLNQNTKNKSKKNIKYHYDLGNDFYGHWLDKTMTYSSAIFSVKNYDLHDAQIHKYDQIAKPMKLNENSNLLEIGCGWGGFSTYIAKKYKSKIKAITISKAQFEFASQRILKEGLNEKVSIEMKDYRDINQTYSNIVSIEMFEAVGKKYWSIFLDTLKKSLLPEGLASLQIITIRDDKAFKYQNNPDFIQQYIFPGGILPSKRQLKDLSLDMGLSFKEQQNFKNSYAKTLKLWNQKFQKAWPDISLQQGFSLRFKKMWEYYLTYCEVGFITGVTDVSHFIIKK